MNITQIQNFFEKLKEKNPVPRIELQYSTPFELLVSVLLSARTKDKMVNKITTVLYPIANTPEKILNLGEKNLIKYIQHIGLFRMKTKYLLQTSQILLSKYNGNVPNNRGSLQLLPGIGRKSANVILNVLYQQYTIGVDTHVFRVSNRTGLAIGKTKLAVENILLKKIPNQYLLYAGRWLVLHGRYICKSRQPICKICSVYFFCNFQNKTPL